MLEKFIFTEEKALFEKELALGQIPQDTIAFIADTKEIWTHSTYFKCQQSELTQ